MKISHEPNCAEQGGASDCRHERMRRNSGIAASHAAK
jgi:hypothetical protein